MPPMPTAWFYRHPPPVARKNKDRVAFADGVEVVASGPQTSGGVQSCSNTRLAREIDAGRRN
jgi:hypothetical protein